MVIRLVRGLAILGLAMFAVACSDSDRSADAGESAKVLRVGVNPNFPPMSYYGPENNLQGFDVDIAQAIADGLGRELELVPTEAAQRVPFLTSGRIDLSLGALTRTPARQRVIDFTIPLHTEAMGVLTTADMDIDSYKDLNRPEITLSNMRGNNSVAVLEKELPKARKLLVDGNADVVRAIAQGRADAMVENVDFFIRFTKNYKKIDWVVLDDPILVAYCGVGVAKGNDALREDVNDVLRKLHSSGEVNATWERWYEAPMTVPLTPEDLVEQPLAE